nr:DUF6443 domain-containing protein [Bacteroidota bacterium]
MKTESYILFVIAVLFYNNVNAQGGDGFDHRILSSYQNQEEAARKSIHFVPGYEVSDNVLHAYIDPDIPFNGGEVVTDGVFNMNYIRTYVPALDNETQVIPNHQQLDYDQWNEEIEYFDGLGRSIQKIAVKAGPLGADIIIPMKYDQYNNANKEFLPMALVQDGTNGPGGYRPDAFSEQEAFNKYFFEKTSHFANSTIYYDNSPLNRRKRFHPPGEAWNTGSGKPIEYYYFINTGELTDEDMVFIFEAGIGVLKKKSFYLAGSLYKSLVKDEGGNEVIEFKDLDGQLICEKKYDGQNWLATYYVYDIKGLLRYVLPPKAMNHIDFGSNTQSFDNDEDWIKDLCYYYEYDTRKRMTLKRLPGAYPIYLIYNRADLLVMSQDGNQRAQNQWLFNKYDVMKRQVISGIYTTDSPVLPEDMQANFDNQNVELFENPDVGQEHWFTNNTFPDHNANNCTINSVNFYDAYFDDATFESRYGYLSSHADGLPDDYLTNIKGQLTITKTKILDNSEIDLGLSNDYLLSVNYYDRLSRIIQNVSDNHFGETLRTSFCYNFTGDLLLKKETQTKIKQAYSYTTINKYDSRKRLIESDELFQDEVYKSSFDYDELGKQKRINLLRQNGTKIQRIDHKYNMRGWLTDINNVEKPENDLFALRLHYAQPTNPQYNGNISAAEWYSTEFGVNKYDYAYDNTNRLKSAIYSGNSSYNYNTSYDYDKNGNITNLNRFGNLGASQVCAEIDKLSYSYTGNQLIQVNDLFDDNHQNNGFKDNGTTLPIEYSYDFNGNMIEDKNKALTVDAYNLLNLPQQLNITGTNTNGTIMQSVNYLYAANGQKLRKQTRLDHQLATTYDYAGRFVYSDLNGDDTELSYLMANQGRIILNEDGSSGYEYSIKDHLGNTRITFDENGTVLQEDAYYPFGMNISGLSYNQNTIQNKYKYNGKELQDEFGLDWYDYGARFYDAPIGRFHTIDPLSEEYYFQSPFVYAANNPILNIDLYGAGPWDIAKGTGLIVGGGVQWV